MGEGHLTGSDKTTFLNYIVKLMSTGMQTELIATRQEIMNASSDASRSGKTRLSSALIALNSAQIQLNPVAPISFKIQTRRTKAGLLLPYAYNALDSFIGHETISQAILDLFKDEQLDDIKTKVGKTAKVDRKEVAIEMAQILPGLVWWIPKSIRTGDMDILKERPFENAKDELMYRIYKYHRLLDPVESYLENILGISDFDSKELAENIIHDAKRGRIPKGQLTNFLIELPIELSNAFEYGIQAAKNSPMFISIDALSMMAVDIAARLTEFDEKLRPYLAVYVILMMSEVFKELPDYDDHSLGGTLFTRYEEAYIYVVGMALSLGFVADLSDENLAEAASRLVSMDLDVGKSRTDAMSGLTMGGFSRRYSFYSESIRNNDKLQKKFDEETK
jgi:hypothetical protein